MNRFRYITVCIFCTILGISAPTDVLAQGEYLQKGESGVGASLSGVLGKYSDYLGAGAAYSLRSRLDIGMHWGQNFLDPDIWGPAARRTGWGPSVSLHLLKPSSFFPVSISAFAGHSFFKYTGDESSFANRITESFASSLGFSMFFEVPFGSNLRMIPINDFGMTRSSVYILDEQGREISDREDNFFWTVSLPLVYRINSGWQLILAPTFTSSDSRYYFGLRAGIVLGWTRKTPPGRRPVEDEWPKFLQSPEL